MRALAGPIVRSGTAGDRRAVAIGLDLRFGQRGSVGAFGVVEAAVGLAVLVVVDADLGVALEN